MRTMFLLRSSRVHRLRPGVHREVDMLKTFVEEAAALTSIILFVGTIAVWAQVIPHL